VTLSLLIQSRVFNNFDFGGFQAGSAGLQQIYVPSQQAA
jgi:hypothetical protein